MLALILPIALAGSGVFNEEEAQTWQDLRYSLEGITPARFERLVMPCPVCHNMLSGEMFSQHFTHCMLAEGLHPDF